VGAARKIVVEAWIPAPVELVWERSQDADQHASWDLRFTTIGYLPEKDARGYHLMDYRTRIALGVEIVGVGRYLHSTPLRHSTFEFDSEDWKSIIRDGRGIWQYEPRPGGTYFKTVYDYDHRHGAFGRALDRLLFRRLLQLATEWSFETLRQWCEGDASALERRRSRLRFGLFFLRRLLGAKPAPGAARSWLGTGREPSELRDMPSAA
jgi:hypothetical protein